MKVAGGSSEATNSSKDPPRVLTYAAALRSLSGKRQRGHSLGPRLLTHFRLLRYPEIAADRLGLLDGRQAVEPQDALLVAVLSHHSEPERALGVCPRHGALGHHVQHGARGRSRGLLSRPDWLNPGNEGGGHNVPLGAHDGGIATGVLRSVEGRAPMDLRNNSSCARCCAWGYVSAMIGVL